MTTAPEEHQNLGDEFDRLIDVNYPEFKKALGPVGTHLRHLRQQIRAHLNDAMTFTLTAKEALAEAGKWEGRIAADGGFICAHGEDAADDCRTLLNHLFPEVKRFLIDFLRFKARVLLSGPVPTPIMQAANDTRSHTMFISHHGISYGSPLAEDSSHGYKSV